MPKKAKKTKTKKRRVKKIEDTQIMFDSTEGSTKSLFLAGKDEANETVITFADSKNTDVKELEEELKTFNIKFLNSGVAGESSNLPLVPPIKRKKNLFWSFFLLILVGLIVAGLSPGLFYDFATPVVRETISSIVSNSEKLKVSGLLSPKAQAFTAGLYWSVENLFGAAAKSLGK